MTQALQGLLRSALVSALLIGLTLGGVAQAYTLEEFQFDSPTQETQFRELVAKLRCLVCQNESLAGSQAELAQDLRKEVYGMMRAGQSEDEILDFLVSRYGDFVLYDPPLKPSTYFLWFGPFVLLGLGAVIAVRTILQKRSVPETHVSEQDRERLEALLNTASDQTAAVDTSHPPDRSRS